MQTIKHTIGDQTFEIRPLTFAEVKRVRNEAGLPYDIVNEWVLGAELEKLPEDTPFPELVGLANHIWDLTWGSQRAEGNSSRSSSEN